MRARRSNSFAFVALACASSAHANEARTLRVCAEPENLPYSNRDRAGFENAIVDVVARALDAKVEYVWWQQQRGFARKTLGAGTCDLWPGVATDVTTMETTAPYYRSTYVFVTRRDDRLDIASFDDPRLKTLRVAVQMIGNDATNTPPAHALARRGITSNVRGFMVYGAEGNEGPSPIMQAVADKAVDVAIVWGPAAGWFARQSPTPLDLRPTPVSDDKLPMTFEVSMGVKKGNDALKADVDRAVAKQRDSIDGILDTFGVPRVADDDAKRRIATTAHQSR